MSTTTCTTPPPTSGICTPPAPKHGYIDHWEPFGRGPRKSARLSSQRPAHRTPSPRSPQRNTPDLADHNLRSPRSTRKSHTSTGHMATPAISPRKKRVSGDSVRRSSATLTAESTAHAAAALGIADKADTRAAAASHSAPPRAGIFLPTPAKTPSDRPAEANKVNVQAIARNLFSSDKDMMPKKARSGHYVLDSFTSENGNASIDIYTDSHERIPEADNSLDNPFYGPGAAAAPPPEPVKRRSARKVFVPGEGDKPVDEIAGSNKGMVFSFRGKRVFKEFPQSDDGEDDEDEQPVSDLPARLSRPLTRASVKPRVLFPVVGRRPATTARDASAHDDEEADTELEDAADESGAEATTTSTAESTSSAKGPRFVPTSSPTSRATRSVNRLAAEATPHKGPRAKKRSPFEGWRVSKNSSAGHGQKRSAEPLLGDAPKRTRA